MEESVFSSPTAAVFSSVTDQIPSGSLKRDRATPFGATLSVDEKGIQTPICNHCQNVIRAGSEEKEMRNMNARTEEEENVKAQTLSVCKENPIGPLAVINEDELSTENKILLRTAKEALIQLSKAREAREGEKIRLKTANDRVKELGRKCE